MKKLILLTLFIFYLQNSFAQDEIFLNDNSKLIVTIIDADSAQVKYTLKSDPSGTVKTEVAKHIKLIYYEDGRILNYSHPEKVHKAPHQYNPKEAYYKTHYNLDLGDSELTASKNIIFYNAGEIANSSLGISYWREMFKSRLFFQLSAGTGFSTPFLYNLTTHDFNDVRNFYPTKKAFDVGAGLYFNTFGHGVISHFIGPMVRTAQYNGTFETVYTTYIFDVSGQQVPVANYEKHGFVYNEYYAYLNNGLLIRISEHFDLMMNIAVGMRTPKYFIANNPYSVYLNSENAGKSTDAAKPAFQAGFSFGYRF